LIRWFMKHNLPSRMAAADVRVGAQMGAAKAVNKQTIKKMINVSPSFFVAVMKEVFYDNFIYG
jgi:hypothetical protein